MFGKTHYQIGAEPQNDQPGDVARAVIGREEEVVQVALQVRAAPALRGKVVVLAKTNFPQLSIVKKLTNTNLDISTQEPLATYVVCEHSTKN